MKTKEKIEIIKKQIEEFKKDDLTTHLYEDDKTAIIIVNVDNSPYQQFSGNNMLSNDFFDFIDDTYKLIDNKKKSIKIKLIFNESFSSQEKERIVSLINMHYALGVKESKKSIRKTKIISILLLIFGSLLMGLYGILCYLEKNFIFRETIGIFSWVFLWEACDLLFFTNSSNRMKMLQCFVIWESEKIIQ